MQAWSTLSDMDLSLSGFLGHRSNYSCFDPGTSGRDSDAKGANFIKECILELHLRYY